MDEELNGQGTDKGATEKPGETIPKGDYDKVMGELEDIRNEVLSPEYLEFLQSKSKPKAEPKTEVTPGEEQTVYGLTQSQVEKMSKSELAQHIAKNVGEEADRKISKVKEELTSGEKEQVRKEIKVFGRSHTDFDKYKPAMHGLSLDPKNSDLTLQELYDKAKEMYPSGPTEEEKKRTIKMKGEKPGGDNDSYDRLKKLTPNEAALEALKETKEKLGIDSMPNA